MTRRRSVCLVVLGLLSSWARESTGAGPGDSVVRVSASIRMPNPIRPWSRQNPAEVGGTGVVIDAKTILTNAHIVLYEGEVFVQDRNGGDRVEAKVATTGPEIDLATLSIEGDEGEAFFQKHPPMPRAEKRPTIGSPVALLGFVVGEVNLARTEGTIARLDWASYGDRVEGMSIQVNAGVAQGNSGGPTLVGEKMVGLTFGQFGQGRNVGYVIPQEEIDGYLEDVKDGHYDGQAFIEDLFQAAENEALRARFGLSRTDRGVLVSRLARPGHSTLCEGDVIAQVGGQQVHNQGQVDLNGGLRAPFTTLAPRLAKAGPIPIRVIRDGKPIDATFPTASGDDHLLKSYEGEYPPYFVHGPLVFTPAMRGVDSLYGRNNPVALAGSPLATREFDRVEFEGEQLVVVASPFLPHRITRGYADPFGFVVRDIDGVAVRNLQHLVELISDGKGEFVTFRFFGEFAETMVFRRKAVEEATTALMAEHDIPARGSADAMTVWQAKAARRSPTSKLDGRD